ncbi:metalloendoproteinase 1-like [Papaver somniferum]|uniref:metalloendoproteinase 1-like n=1 Tax=Papaver somniferum TaxID=3469 RepID=UPI000E6FB441|nr:metalloendoproteinase 1-like [Papaver somniferum]
MELVYRFRSSAAANVDSATLQSASIRALSSWSAVSNFRFRVPTSFREINDIMMRFHRLVHGGGNPFDGPLGVLGHASGPDGEEAHLDADENWSSNPDQSMIDLESLCLHELGHVLGLGHSSDTNAVMFSGIGGGQQKRKPTTDDINAISALYS